VFGGVVWYEEEQYSYEEEQYEEDKYEEGKYEEEQYEEEQYEEEQEEEEDMVDDNFRQFVTFYFHQIFVHGFSYITAVNLNEVCRLYVHQV